MTSPSASGPPADRHRLRLALAALGSAGAALAGGLFLGKRQRHARDERSGRGSPKAPPSLGARDSGHETEDMSGRTMSWVLASLGALLACSIGLMVLMVGYFHQERSTARPAFTAEQTRTLAIPGPNLQDDPDGDIERLHRNEDRLLHNYGWVDAGHRRARIPIGRATTLVIGRTLDAAP